MIEKIYITKAGERIVYSYPDSSFKRSEATHRPRCPLMGCGVALIQVCTGVGTTRTKRGYYCPQCESLFINDGMKIFRIKRVEK